MILDVFSRYVVGWMVAHRESATLAKRLIAETCERQKIGRGELTLHADRGSSMKSKAVALLLSDLGVTKTPSRPHVSDDNPYLETNFKTLKYRPEFPERFGLCDVPARSCTPTLLYKSSPSMVAVASSPRLPRSLSIRPTTRKDG